ncbi:MAG TPA: hypothetical protein VK572_11590, partial [Burkholderiales bacterium]|nr:hypothetical protein [Burkholderiales bacterium]
MRDELAQRIFGLGLFGTVGWEKRSHSVIVRYHQKSQCAVLVGITLQVVDEHRRIFDLQSRGRRFDSDPRLQFSASRGVTLPFADDDAARLRAIAAR